MTAIIPSNKATSAVGIHAVDEWQKAGHANRAAHQRAVYQRFGPPEIPSFFPILFA
jgi:hypothetical protein